MIISDTHKFIFVHIPKCAGTSLRSRIEHLNDHYNTFRNIQTHPEAGLLDYGHLPLQSLAAYFPDTFEKLKTYWTFTVIRDPFARFPSCVGQYLRQHSDTPLYSLTPEQVDAQIEALLEKFRAHDWKSDATLALFLPQADFVDHQGTRMVDTLYQISQLDQIVQEIATHSGCDLPSVAQGGAKNESFVYKNDAVRRVMNVARPALGVVTQILPDATKARLRKALYTKASDALSEVYNSDKITAFVRDVYRDDVALYQAQKALPTAQHSA